MQFRHAVEFEVALDGIADVFHGLGHGRALGMAAGQFGATDGHAFRMFEQCDVVFACYLADRLSPGVGFVNAERAGFYSACLIPPLARVAHRAIDAQKSKDLSFEMSFQFQVFSFQSR